MLFLEKVLSSLPGSNRHQLSLETFISNSIEVCHVTHCRHKPFELHKNYQVVVLDISKAIGTQLFRINFNLMVVFQVKIALD